MSKLDFENTVRLALGLTNAAVATLLTEMRPRLAHVAYDKFGHLGADEAQLIDEAEGLLHEWLCDPERQERLWSSRSFDSLAWRLLAQVAKQQTREWEKDHREEQMNEAVMKSEGEIEQAKPGAGAAAIDAARLVDGLPELHRLTLLAEAERLLDGGPRTLAQRLGVTAEAAKKRLARAQLALQARLRAQEAADG
jgi:DNA-directed RNA polymerase specialized sigma24 family protein